MLEAQQVRLTSGQQAGQPALWANKQHAGVQVTGLALRVTGKPGLDCAERAMEPHSPLVLELSALLVYPWWLRRRLLGNISEMLPMLLPPVCVLCSHTAVEQHQGKSLRYCATSNS